MTEFNVPEMHCGACVNRITKAIIASDPGATVETKIPERKVMIESRLNVDRLIAVMQEAGYSAARI